MSAFLSRTEVWVVALATAAFLALYWAFRGAPIGQAAEDEGNEAPRASYREVLSAAQPWSSLVSEVGYVAAAGGAERAPDLEQVVTCHIRSRGLGSS